MAVGHQQVLGRDAGNVGHGQVLVEVAGEGHVGQAEVQGAGQLGGPAQRQGIAVFQIDRDRAPAGLAHFEFDRLATLHFDPLAVGAQHGFAAGHAVAQPVGIGELDAVEIQPVAVAVGEAPGDVAIAADDHRRDAGQGEAADIDLAAGCARIGITQARAEPDVRCAQAQVHVVGDDGTAIARAAAGDGEVVAARGGRFGHGVVAVFFGHGQRAQVHFAGAGQGGIAARFAEQGRVPLAAVGGDQIVKRRRQHFADAPERQFARVRFVLQVEEHRVAGQCGVLHRPRLRIGPQQQVGPGRAVQGQHAGIDAVAVGLERGQAVAGDLAQVFAQARPQAVHAHLLVAVDRDLAEQRRQFAGGRAPQQVHFEETFLRVHEAQGPGGVDFVGCIDGDDAQGVAADRHRRR